LPESLKNQYANQENLKRMARLKKLAEELSLPLGVLSLAYIVSQPFPAYAISGCSHIEQLLENLKAGDVQLEPELLDYLDN
jgi:aryl-alcohol dehydrogenase-like predicted oxidoreductase